MFPEFPEFIQNLSMHTNVLTRFKYVHICNVLIFKQIK